MKIPCTPPRFRIGPNRCPAPAFSGVSALAPFAAIGTAGGLPTRDPKANRRGIRRRRSGIGAGKSHGCAERRRGSSPSRGPLARCATGFHSQCGARSGSGTGRTRTFAARAKPGNCTDSGSWNRHAFRPVRLRPSSCQALWSCPRGLPVRNVWPTICITGFDPLPFTKGQ